VPVLFSKNMMKKISAFAALFFCCTILCAQTGKEWLAKAQESEETDLELAKTQTNQSLQACERERDLSTWIQAQRVLAEIVLAQTQNPFEAIQATEQALANPFLSPQTEDEYYYYCKFLTFKSWLGKQVGDFVRVKADLEKAHWIFNEKLAGKHLPIANYLYAELGNAYVRLAEYQGARQIFEENLHYSQRFPTVAKFNDYGSLYLTTDSLANALKIFQNGLIFNKIQADTSKLPDAEIKLLYLNLAECLARMGRFSEALEMNKKADRAPLDPDDGRYQRCLFGLYENYGIIYAGMAKAGDKSKFPLAEKWYQKALDVATDPADRSPNREIAGFQIALAEVWLAAGKPQDALQGFHDALKLLLPNFDAPSAQNPSLMLLFAEKMLIRALEGKAKAFVALGQPAKALECYELIPVAEAKMRATHAYESSSLLTLSDSRKRFDAAITLAWQLYTASAQDRRYAERAFLLSEQARGMLLLQSLARAQADYQLPPEVRQQERDLKSKMGWYEHEIGGEKERGPDADAARLTQLEKELFALKQQQERFKSELRDRFPDYARLSDELHFASVNEVRALLRPEQAMVDYYLTESDVYAFYFDAAGAFLWHKKLIDNNLRDTVSVFVKYLYDGDESDPGRKQAFLKAASQLYDLLLGEPLRNTPTTVRSLLIVPDDALVFMPFEVLLRQPAEGAWRKMPWLLRDFSIGYAYSATLLQRQKEISQRHQKEARPRYSMGGFAPSYGGGQAATREAPLPDYPLYDIKSTQDELRKAHEMVGGKAFYQDATEEAFKRIAADCRILLLAMHGYANDEYPERSCLLFGTPKSDSLHNNILYASELQVMQLHADLAVLSACHTGFGKLQKGEGVYSLARAFAAAGVPCTVMSLWRLHENTAPLLVEAFFKHLKAGKTKDEALRLAKLEFLDKDQNYEMTHPFFWAGVMATGDLCALDLDEPSPSWKWLLLAGASLLAGFFFWKKRRKRA
jgi:CHAT domain-containing protein